MLSKVTTNILVEPFRVLGLGQEHADAYLSLLELGTAPVAVLAKNLALPRSSLYLVLSELEEAGLAAPVEGGKKKQYLAVNPERVKDLLEERARDVRRVDLDLRANFSLIDSLFLNHRSSFPKVNFFEGEEGLKALYLGSLWADEILAVSFLGGDADFLVNEPGYLREFNRLSLEREVLRRRLVEASPFAEDYRQRSANKIYRLGVLPKGLGASAGKLDKLLYADKVAYVAHERLVGLVVEDAAMAAVEKTAFELLWSQFGKG